MVSALPIEQTTTSVRSLSVLKRFIEFRGKPESGPWRRVSRKCVIITGHRVGRGRACGQFSAKLIARSARGRGMGKKGRRNDNTFSESSLRSGSNPMPFW